MVQFIDDHRDVFGVEPICAVLPIAPSTYHRHRHQRTNPAHRSARAQRDDQLRVEIQRVYDEHQQVYGPRKVWKCWCGLRGDRPTKLWIKTFDPSNGLQTSVSGGFGVVEIGGISGACPRWVTDPAAEPAPPDHKRGVTETAPPRAAAGGIQVPPMRPVTSQVAAEIGYDPAGGTDPGPFTQQVAERLHAADPRWGRRINSTGPISDDTVAYRVGTSPVNPLSIDIRTRRPYHPRPAPVAHLRSLGGDAGGPSHYIPAYLGISRYISDPFFCSRAPRRRRSPSVHVDFGCGPGTASWAVMNILSNDACVTTIGSRP